MGVFEEIYRFIVPFDILDVLEGSLCRRAMSLSMAVMYRIKMRAGNRYYTLQPGMAPLPDHGVLHGPVKVEVWLERAGEQDKLWWREYEVADKYDVTPIQHDLMEELYKGKVLFFFQSDFPNLKM